MILIITLAGKTMLKLLRILIFWFSLATMPKKVSISDDVAARCCNISLICVVRVRGCVTRVIFRHFWPVHKSPLIFVSLLLNENKTKNSIRKCRIRQNNIFSVSCDVCRVMSNTFQIDHLYLLSVCLTFCMCRRFTALETAFITEETDFSICAYHIQPCPCPKRIGQQQYFIVYEWKQLSGSGHVWPHAPHMIVSA